MGRKTTGNREVGYIINSSITSETISVTAL